MNRNKFFKGEVSERKYYIGSSAFKANSIKELASTIKAIFDTALLGQQRDEPFYYKNRQDQTISLKMQQGIEIRVREGLNALELEALARLTTSQKDTKDAVEDDD